MFLKKVRAKTRKKVRFSISMSLKNFFPLKIEFSDQIPILIYWLWAIFLVKKILKKASKQKVEILWYSSLEEALAGDRKTFEVYGNSKKCSGTPILTIL